MKLIATLAASAVLLASPQSRDAARVPVATGTAQVTGAVSTADASPAPLRRVTMTLTGDRSGVNAVAVTDDSGQFAFTSLPPDRYTVAAAKGGYLPTRYGSKRPGGSGTPVVVAEGQRAAIALTMIRGSVITGTVRDGLGAPVPDVTVTALRFAVSSQSGERGPQAATMGSSAQRSNYAPDAFPGTAMTDDRGVYRIFGLAPGEYLVSVSVRPPIANPMASTDIHQVSREDVARAQQLLRGSGGAAASTSAPRADVDTSRVNYAPVFHPSAFTVAEATVVTLGQTEERSAVDVLVRLVPTATVSGTASFPDGTPVSGVQISLMNNGPSGTGFAVGRATRSNDDGTFAIPGVNPGRYLLRGSTTSDGFSGVSEVDVAGRDVSASMVFVPGGAISGRLVFDGTTKPPDVKEVPLIPLPLGLGGLGYEMAADGRFKLSKLAPASYRIRINGRPPAGWLLRSVMLNGVDVSDVAFELKAGESIDGAVVTLTDRGAEVSGRFVDAAGRPAPEYVLVIFSADRRYWVPQTRRTQQVRPDANGVFVARDLPAGDYLISAVTDLEDGQWHDPAFLATLAASSIKITLAEGDRKVQDIRVGGRHAASTSAIVFGIPGPSTRPPVAVTSTSSSRRQPRASRNFSTSVQLMNAA
jgi:protocatechuate 3,4-dioxygenase beta subunit